MSFFGYCICAVLVIVSTSDLAADPQDSLVLKCEGKWLSLLEEDKPLIEGLSRAGAKFTVWLDFSQPYNARVDTDPRYSEWTDGSADRWQTSGTEFVTPANHVSIQHTAGPAGKSEPIRTSTIEASSLDAAFQIRLQAFAILIPAFFQPAGVSTSVPWDEFVQKCEKSDGQLSIDGKIYKCQVFLLKYLKNAEQLYYSPELNLILKRVSDQGSVKIEYSVIKIGELSTPVHFYYPAVGLFESFVKGKTYRKIEYSIDKATLNNDRTVFEPKIPDGYWVSDKRFGIQFEVDSKAKKLDDVSKIK